MSKKWTPNQSNAINARGKNILVSAAAGSGKTAVLVERVIKYITDEKNPIDVDKLLVVTFTNAAAAEMKSRISAALNDIISADPNNTNAIRQLSLLPGAKVCTIDSFCINLVRENFFKLDISQDFGIIENAEEQILIRSTIEEILERKHTEGDDSFFELCELLSTPKSDSNLIDAVIKVYNYILSQPFPFAWLDSLLELYNPDLSVEETSVGEYVVEQIALYCGEALQIIDDTADNLDNDDMYDKYMETLSADKIIFERIIEACDEGWDSIKTAVDSVGFVTLPRSSKGYCGLSKALIKANREIYKSLYKKDIMSLVGVTSAEYKEDCKCLYPILEQLIDIVKSLCREMMEKKKELNRYSFSDILHFATDLLLYIDDNGDTAQTDLAVEMKNGFAEILVDEYQDTNYAQDALFAALSNGHNRFMVGDIKQSIYRFRLAMPKIFNDKKDTYSLYSPQNDDVNQKIFLDMNFRSRKGICDYTNMVFSNIMTRSVGEIDYNYFEYLNNGASYFDSNVISAQLKLIDTPDNVDSVEYEARQVAKYIIHKVSSKEQIQSGDGTRDVTYSDIAVLFRSASGKIPVFTKVFTEYGIPVVTENKSNLFDCNEVSILLSLIRVIDNPVQDVYLLSTLMSVFYGYTADDIAAARVNYPGSNLYASISCDSRFDDFINDLDKYRSYASSMSVESLLRQIIVDTSYLSVISAMGNGEQRKQNVLKLAEIAKTFDSGDNVGLTAFVRYFDRIISSGFVMQCPAVNSFSDNSVSFMSIHKSKGLEFPICILANSSGRYNNDDLKGDVQLNNSGIGLKALNKEGMFKYDTQQYLAMKRRNAISSISENLRVLYVAITRAKEQFVAFATFSNLEHSVNKLGNNIVSGKILPAVVRHANSDAELLIMTSLLHKDADILRDMCEKPITVNYDYDFSIDIDIINDAVENELKPQQESIIESTMTDAIRDRLSYRYQRRSLAGFIGKRTASSLDEKDYDFKYIASSKPAFLEKSGMTAAQRGTAMHAFMQHCDYYNARECIEDEIDRLVRCEYLSREQGACLDRAKLKELFGSDFAERMFSSDKIYREINVSSFVKVNRLEDTEYDDKVLIQGIADCVFEENGELVLVDYKTDRATDEEELLDRYKNQIAFYKYAVSKTLNKPVKEAMLYSFYFGKCCKYKKI